MSIGRRVTAAFSALSLLLGSPTAATLAATIAPTPEIELKIPIPETTVPRLTAVTRKSTPTPEGFYLGESLDSLKSTSLSAARFDGSRSGERRDVFIHAPKQSRQSIRQKNSTPVPKTIRTPRPVPAPSVEPASNATPIAHRWIDEVAKFAKETISYCKKTYRRTEEYLHRKFGRSPPPPPIRADRSPRPPVPATQVKQPPRPRSIKRKHKGFSNHRIPVPNPAVISEPVSEKPVPGNPFPEQVVPEKSSADPDPLPEEIPAPTPTQIPEPVTGKPVTEKPSIDPGPMPEFVAGNFGVGVYDVLSWGFWDGESKSILEMARKEVNEAAMEFSRSITPGLSSSLRKIFLQLEENTETGAAAKLRFDVSFPEDWYQAGAVSARLIHAVDDAQKAIEAVLARFSGLFYEGAAVELELRLAETALQAGALSLEASADLGARRDILAARREELLAQMRQVIGRDKDFSGIVTAADEDYLTLLAKDAGDGFMSDARTKRWLTQRVSAVMDLIEFQVKKKAALEALKMALLSEKNLGDGKKDVIDDFIKLTREGLSVAGAIESATQSGDLRQAVLESQREFAANAEAGSQLKLAKMLKQLALYDIIPNLRFGIEEGWREGSGMDRPGAGFHVRWAATSAIRLLWSGEDLQAPKLEEEIAKMNLLQAARDKRYNFERATAAVARYAEKVALDGGYPNAEDIALYGRARQVYSYSPDVSVPTDIATLETSSATAVGTLKDLLTVAVDHSPLARIAGLRLKQSEENVKKSEQRVNAEVGGGGGEMIIDSLLPSLVVTLENLGRQKEAAQVKRLGTSLRQAKRVFEIMYAVLHDCNDYLFALEKIEAAQAAIQTAAAANDKKALQAAQAARIEAGYRAGHVEAELRRLLGPGMALPTKEALADIFSRDNDQLYWGNPLFKQFNMDATINEAAQRVMEDLVETQKALSVVPELKLHMSGILAVILSPAMPWTNVLLAIDAARTGLPPLSRLLSKLFPGKAEKERQAKLTEFYRQLWANKKSADALSEEYMRQREELKSMGRGLPQDPKSAEDIHQFNRWRIAALAYDIAPGAEDFLADRIVERVEAGRFKEAADLWRFSHAKEKLEAGGRPSKTGEMLRQKLNENTEFKKDLAKRILAADDWFEAKLLFDPWIENFRLDFGAELGGKIVEKIVQKGYVAFFEGAQDNGMGGDASVVPQLKEAVDAGKLEQAYELYKKQIGFETHKQEVMSQAQEGPAENLPLTSDTLGDPSRRRALTRRVIALVRSGRYQKGQELLAAAVEMYREAHVDFDKHYPGLKSWVVGWSARNQLPAQEDVKSADFKFSVPSWVRGKTHSLKEVLFKRKPVRRGYRITPEWDLHAQWNSVTLAETLTDRENGISESRLIMRENYQDAESERHQYVFSGPMGLLGDLRLNAGGTLPITREHPWNPVSPLRVSMEGVGDSFYSLGLNQRGLLPGFDLSEKIVYRLFSNGTRRNEYGLGASGLWNGSYNFGDLTLLSETRPDKNDGKAASHFRSYGRFGYGREEDRFSSAFQWQADDLYGYTEGVTSGEFNLSGRYRPSVFQDLQSDIFWSATAYKNRNYITSGRFYQDTYVKDISGLVPTDRFGMPETDGMSAYAGLRQMLVAGKYGGIGMGYAVENKTGDKARQYRIASYVLPDSRGQVDVINSDDPTVGPWAAQAQTVAGPALIRLGTDASNHAAAVGVRDPGGNLSVVARLVQSAQDSSSHAWGAALSSLDSSYQALWSNHNDVHAGFNQGDVWLGNGMQFDYRKSSYSKGETYRLKMALSSFTEASNRMNFVPFAPLVKGVYKAVGALMAPKDVKSDEQVVEELDSTTTRRDLAKKAAELMETASRRAGNEAQENRSASLFLGDVVSDMSESYDDFRRQGNTPIPYSWKPDFQTFLSSLSDLIPQLRQAQESALFDRSERLENSWFAWTPKIIDELNDVLHKYEIYRAAYREQIMAIPVSGGIDHRPDHIAAFNKRSQWFVDYTVFIKNEFLEMDRIGKMTDEEVRGQLTALYRLRDENPLDRTHVPAKKALEFLGPSSWLPTSRDVHIRVLDNRVKRLLAERSRRQALDGRIDNLKTRASSSRRREKP